MCGLLVGCSNNDYSGSIKTVTTNGRVDYLEIRYPGHQGSVVKVNNLEEVERAIAQTEMILFTLKEAKKNLQPREVQ